MVILMVGATGTYAGLVLPELKQRGSTVRALIRNANAEAEARAHGADEVVVADLSKPETLGRAAEGADGVFHINPAFGQHEAEMGVAMVKAARQAGVRKFVFSGVIHPSIARMSNHAGKQAVEQAIYESGMTWTVLQPTMFMQTLGMSWKAIVEHGRFALPYSPKKRACYVDYRDVAEAAAIGLTETRLDNGTFELCAEGMLDRFEVAALMSEALGRTVEAGEAPFDDWVKQAGIPAGPLSDGLRAMYEDYDRFGFPGGNALVLRAVLGREPRTLSAYLKELAARTSA